MGKKEIEKIKPIAKTLLKKDYNPPTTLPQRRAPRSIKVKIKKL